MRCWSAIVACGRGRVRWCKSSVPGTTAWAWAGRRSAMPFAAVGRRLLALVQSVVAHDGGDAQPVVLEDAAPAGRLCSPVVFGVSPLRHRGFVAKERERQQLARVGE